MISNFERPIPMVHVYFTSIQQNTEFLKKRANENVLRHYAFYFIFQKIIGSTESTKEIYRGISRVPPAGWRNAPAYSREGVLGKVLGDWADLALRQTHKKTRSRVVRAAGA